MRDFVSMGVAGAHGKTSTTGMKIVSASCLTSQTSLDWAG